MALHVLRAAFIVMFASVTLLYVLSYQQFWLLRPLQGPQDEGTSLSTILLMLGVSLALALTIAALDMFIKSKRLSAISGIFLGLIAGLLAAYGLSFVVNLIGLLFAPEGPQERVAFANLLEGVKVLIGLVTCYLGISLVMQTKDDFRFVIPYVEFAKQIRGNRPIVLDTSVIIDGRILEVIQTRAIEGILIIPRFVLHELQTIADSTDKLRRARGRRGLETLQKLQDTPFVEVHIDETEVEGPTVDQKLIAMTQQVQGRIMTNDFALTKVATLRRVDVVNLNELAKALRPVALPGEHMRVKMVKPGESSTQGVGYLDDGTMVVVEQGRAHLGSEIDLVVTSTLQTSAGRMIFGRYEQAPPARQPEPDQTAKQNPDPQPGSLAATNAPRPAAPARRNPRHS